ncbi:hypothetical protein NUU61_006008 [Penicillium alfredii]|uniref:AB hydrolase-1 domain-containing protein n=1 Tax=Penicillium alfredii TaxID=1506179 RepID=A0A9W9K2Y0_9EURO|nr:uncharacterized protein NUU61_006008 [Penicillium alfredii]KAJ5091138.1 hypothetical protein NUU61_006008 [Penicillium alfredii]
MANIAFPQHAKHLTLPTSHTYSYIYIPASKPSFTTILFLHGFPSSCFDWRHQIPFFSDLGYGVLAPDLLGYGGTSKPISAEAYRAKKMATEITEILDHEGLQRVHAVAHDTGCILLSRMANYVPDRLLSSSFLAVPYSRPGEHFDLAAVNAMTKQVLGQERFGYLSFFVGDEAGSLLDQHSESFFILFYPADPALWTDHVGPTGAMEAWLRADRQGQKAPYITDEERVIHQKIMQGNHGPALNWYRVLVGNLNQKDELDAGLSLKLSLPVLMVTPAPSPGHLPGTGAHMNEMADDVTVKEVSTPGHWLQLEARDEANAILKEFFQRCDGTLSGL